MAGHGERSDGGAESRHDLQESIFGEAQPANAGLAGFHGFFPLSSASPPLLAADNSSWSAGMWLR